VYWCARRADRRARAGRSAPGRQGFLDSVAQDACRGRCIPEFACALGIKQRTGAIDVQQAHGAWARFERMVAADLRLLTVEPAHFHRAAELVLDAASALRAGDALHLACAEAVGAKQMATLDEILGRNAQRLKIKPIALRGAP
jgi:hypothetical protein